MVATTLFNGVRPGRRILELPEQTNNVDCSLYVCEFFQDFEIEFMDYKLLPLQGRCASCDIKVYLTVSVISVAFVYAKHTIEVKSNG